MGSSTSRIASKKAAAHLVAGPIALIIAFIGNSLIALLNGTSISKPSGWAILIGGLALFIINTLIATFYSVPSAVKEKCNKELTLTQRLLYSLWPSLFSAIGDPNIVGPITFIIPGLILLYPLISIMLPPGPLTIGGTMLLHKYLLDIPVIGTFISFLPITQVLDLFTGSWFFFTLAFLIGFNFWSWIGAAIAATQAINNNCPENI